MLREENRGGPVMVVVASALLTTRHVAQGSNSSWRLPNVVVRASGRDQRDVLVPFRWLAVVNLDQEPGTRNHALRQRTVLDPTPIKPK